MIPLAFAFVLALLALLAWGRRKAQAGPVDSGMAPDFSLTGFDGRKVTLSELRGMHVGLLKSPEVDQKIEELLADPYPKETQALIDKGLSDFSVACQAHLQPCGGVIA